MTHYKGNMKTKQELYEEVEDLKLQIRLADYFAGAALDYFESDKFSGSIENQLIHRNDSISRTNLIKQALNGTISPADYIEVL